MRLELVALGAACAMQSPSTRGSEFNIALLVKGECHKSLKNNQAFPFRESVAVPPLIIQKRCRVAQPSRRVSACFCMAGWIAQADLSAVHCSG